MVRAGTGEVRGRGRPVVYTGIAAKLRDSIGRNALPARHRLPSMVELGAEYGVSRTAIRKAVLMLQAEGLISVEPGRGIFVASTDTPPPSTGPGALTFSFVTPAIDDPFPAAVQSGLAEAVRQADGHLVAQSAEWVISRELEIVRRLRGSGMAGAVVLPTSGTSLRQEVEALCDATWPLVLVDRFFEGINSSFVGVDHRLGAMLAVQHLIALGHRQIGIIRAVGSSGVEDRFKGYCKAMTAAGMTVDDQLVVQLGQPEHDRELSMGGQAEMTHLLSLAEPPTAVFGVNDHLALGAFWAAHQAGLSVPGDVSIVGFDGLGVETTIPGGLTTVRQPGREIGSRAGELLLARLDSGRKGIQSTVEHIYLRPEFVPGATTAPPTSDR